MAKKKKVEGNCAICSKYGQLTFEHIPPRKAFNEGAISVQIHEQLFDVKSPYYKSYSKSNRGFGRYTLCESCNNNTGDWYARDYIQFAIQGMHHFKNTGNDDFGVEGLYVIKPLNVIKQILAMFLSADHNGFLRTDTELVEFILNRDKTGIPMKYKVYVYSTVSRIKRLNGVQSIMTNKGAIVQWSEFNFNPFGFLLAIKSLPPNELMLDITKFGDFGYNDEYNMNISMPYFKVSSPFNGVYDNIDDSYNN